MMSEKMAKIDSKNRMQEDKSSEFTLGRNPYARSLPSVSCPKMSPNSKYLTVVSLRVDKRQLTIDRFWLRGKNRIMMDLDKVGNNDLTTSG